MNEVVLSDSIIERLEKVYERLGELYDQSAKKLKFTCDGCPDNCCDSYFLHYTYLEWAYLYVGIRALDLAEQEELMRKAHEYKRLCKQADEKGERPQVMCPLNNKGLCSLYKHRLLVCRTHGVPATMTRPDGQLLRFPGCFRCQEIVDKKYLHQVEAPHVERTPFYRELAKIENELLGNQRQQYPRVKLTIADMLAGGPPKLSEKK